MTTYQSNIDGSSSFFSSDLHADGTDAIPARSHSCFHHNLDDRHVHFIMVRCHTQLYLIQRNLPPSLHSSEGFLGTTGEQKPRECLR